MDELGPLPFMLSQENLAKVQIAYASYSAKTGVGKSEISIFGVGRVKLLEETCLDDPNPKVLEGEIPLPILVRVLDAMEEEEFFALEDLYQHSGTPTGTRVIELSLPEKSKKVILMQPALCLPFERIAGAIKLAAGLVLPDALQYRFFGRF